MIGKIIKGERRYFDSKEDYELFKRISEKLQHHIGNERRVDYNLDDYIDEKIRQLTEEVHIFFHNLYLENEHVHFFSKEFKKAF